MAFRNDEVALRSRMDALEAENQQLREENEALRAARGASAPKRIGIWVAVAIGLVLLVGAWYSGFVVSGYTGEQIGIALGIAGALALTLALNLALVQQLLVIARPDEALVLSGRQHMSPDGRLLGYRVVVAGRVLRIPVIERLDRLDLAPMRIELSLGGVYLRRARASITMRASVHIARTPPLMERAVERFLGRPREDIATVARETLEGAARGVLANLTLEELEEDRLKVTEVIIEESEHDLSRMGLVLDQLSLIDVEGRADTA